MKPVEDFKEKLLELRQHAVEVLFVVQQEKGKNKGTPFEDKCYILAVEDFHGCVDRLVGEIDRVSAAATTVSKASFALDTKF